MRALALAALTGCAGLGPAQPWIDAEAIDGPLRPELVLDVAPPPPPGERLRIVSWNVHLGADVDALAAAFDDPALAGADVILLQEIEAHPGEGGSRAARLAAALDLNVVYAPARQEGDGTHGLAILSQHPLEAPMVMELPRADLGVNARRRIALAADVIVDGAPLRVVDVHLDTRLGVSDRVAQLRPAVIDHDARAIVGGDLNTLPYAWLGGLVPDAPAQIATDLDAGAAIDALMAALDFAAPTSALGPTDDLALVDLRLDAIYARELEVTDAAIATGVTVSDHRPVVIEAVRLRR